MYKLFWRKINGIGEYARKSSKSKYNLERYKPLLDVDFRISSKCCDIMKKKPAHDYSKQTGKMPITGQLAEESRLRYQQWLKNGCNGFDMKSPISNPMSFWTEQDVLNYIHTHNLPIASVYGDIILNDENKFVTTGCDRTGCVYCCFGAHCKGDERFLRLKQTHPKHYNYCLNGGEYDSDGLWIPNKNGLGMKHVIDTLNKIYGQDFIKY